MITDGANLYVEALTSFFEVHDFFSLPEEDEA
jgi:hypothetical protein